ncbi:MAG: glycosyltransferase family 39 protein [Myxococcota bacterium]
MSAAPPPTRLHHLSQARVRWVAAAIFVATTALLLATLDMGFCRDESFYFGYSESYQNWFVAAEQAKTPDEVDKVFGREEVLDAWQGNFEHPPLMKALFGFSWRAFAWKDRRASVSARESTLTFDVQAGPATGFALDSEVALLMPLPQGVDPSDDLREIVRGKVSERTRDRAHVEVDVGNPFTAQRLAAICNAPPVKAPASAIAVTPCQGRELRTFAIMKESTAFRLPGVLSGAAAVTLTFLLGVELFGWLVGLFGAFLFLFVPEHFYHAHLCAFDMPITAATLFVFYAFWRSLSSPRWALVTAVAWGLALLTKHNAFFIPFSMIVWWLWTGRDRFGVTRAGLRLQVQLPPLPRALLVMPVVALPMLFSFWPKLWYDSMHAIRDYFAFHLNHDHYMQYWFGDPLQVPPFPLGYPFAKTFFTYTEVFIFLFLVGCLFLAPPAGWWSWLRGLVGRGPPDPDGGAPSDAATAARATSDGGPRTVSVTEKIGAFVLIAGLVPIAVISIPTTPIFGGIKHWMPGAPFLALVAGYGIFRLVRAVRLPERVGIATAFVLLVHPAKASIDHAWVGSSHYNSLFAGGLQGAADKRLMRSFWGHSTQEAIDWLNANAPYNARVYWQDTTWGAYDMYQNDGHLRWDIRYANSQHGAQIALIDGNQAFMELDLDTRQAMGVAGPDWIVTGEGVPYLYVYVRPGTLDAAAPEPTRPPTTKPAKPPPHAPKPPKPAKPSAPAAPNLRSPPTP